MVTKNEAELEMHYVFDIDKLQAGDILLTRIPMNLNNRSTWDSHLIQALTRSKFSSAALYLGEGLCIEGVGTGVARLPLWKAGVRDKRNICLLRPRKDHGWVGRKAAACGARYLQRGFSQSGLPQTKCNAFQDVRRAAIMSSGLVAGAYAEADVALVEDKSPYTSFPGDLLRSSLLEDVTDAMLRRQGSSVPSAFQLDDNTLFERVHHWEVATQLKVLCNYEVRRMLETQAIRPASMHELELLIADKKWKALDETANRCLLWYRYAENYLIKQQRLLGDFAITKSTPAALRSFSTVLDDLAHATDLCLLQAEHAHWVQQRNYYSEMQQRYDGKLFGYMLSLYHKQLAAFEPLLQFKLQQKYAYKNEIKRSGSQLKTA